MAHEISHIEIAIRLEMNLYLNDDPDEVDFAREAFWLLAKFINKLDSYNTPSKSEELLIQRIAHLIPRGIIQERMLYRNLDETAKKNPMFFHPLGTAVETKCEVLVFCESYPEIAETILYSKEMEVLDGEIEWLMSSENAPKLWKSDLKYIEKWCKGYLEYDFVKFVCDTLRQRASELLLPE